MLQELDIEKKKVMVEILKEARDLREKEILFLQLEIARLKNKLEELDKQKI